MSSVDENIPKGWVETTLREVASKIIDYRGKTPKKLGGDWDLNGNYRALSAKSVKTGGLINLDQIKRVDHYLYKKWMKDEIQFNDILLTSEAPMGEVLLWNSDEKIVLSQRLFAIRAKENISPNYLYYYFISKAFQHELNARASGTTVLGIRQTELFKTNVVIPPLPEQKAIANILTAFDDKIENLQAQNKTLEQTAQTIFKEWFGKYQVGDELPEGWRVGKIYDVLDVQYGYPFKSKLFNEKRVGLPLIRIRDIRKGVTDYFTDEECLDEYIVNSGDVLAGMDAVFQPYLWSGKKGLLNQRVCRFIPKEFSSRIFSLEFMRPHLSFYEKTKVGTTVIHLGKGDLDFIETVIPSEDIISRFKGLSTPIEEKIINNNREIQTLKKTRDTLLPKLMSGQLRVNEFNE